VFFYAPQCTVPDNVVLAHQFKLQESFI